MFSTSCSTERIYNTYNEKQDDDFFYDDEDIIQSFDSDEIYTVTWKNGDKPAFSENKGTTQVRKGVRATVPKDVIKNLKRPGTFSFNYDFIGWNRERQFDNIGEIEREIIIEEDTTIYAVYKRKPIRVNWYNGKGIIHQEDVQYNTVTSYPDDLPTPTKREDYKYIYTFAGLSTIRQTNDVVTKSGFQEYKVVADTTLYAVYLEGTELFSVTFYNHDGTKILHTDLVEYGKAPKYTMNNPVIGTDTNYGYSFDGTYAYIFTG